MHVTDLFNDRQLIGKIQKRLPEFFYIAQLESSRAGKIGMEVGVVRERIITALLVHVFGASNVRYNIPTTEAEIDVEVCGTPISIKTVTNTGKKLSGVKLIWTVDHAKAIAFAKSYRPSCDMILVQVKWEGVGGFYYFPQWLQQEVLRRIGVERYMVLPKQGTNPRGVEISSEALTMLANSRDSRKIPIRWIRTVTDHDPFQRWIELWNRS